MSYHTLQNVMTVQEVAELLKLSALTIYKYIKEGSLEAIDFGGYYRIEESSLRRFIQNHKVVKKEEGDE